MHMTPERLDALVNRLREQPEMLAQVEALLEEVENRTGVLGTADQAEDAVVERMRSLGQAALTRWAQRRCEQLNTEAPPQARKDSKKNCGGRRRSEP